MNTSFFDQLSSPFSTFDENEEIALQNSNNLTNLQNNSNFFDKNQNEEFEEVENDENLNKVSVPENFDMRTSFHWQKDERLKKIKRWNCKTMVLLFFFSKNWM
jgi:hypothetical protein